MSPSTEISHLLEVPAEVRLNIYRFLIDIKGTLTVYAGYEIAKEVDTQTVKLMHVNRLIRGEVQEFFYKNQRFEFRSTSAIDNFLERIGRQNASLIRQVQFADWMCARLKPEHIVNLLGWLTGVDHLVLMGMTHSRNRYVIYKSAEDKYTVSNNALTIMCSSAKLAKGKVWISSNVARWYTPASWVLFLPKDVDPSIAYHHQVPRFGQASCYLRLQNARYCEVSVPDELFVHNKETNNNQPSSKRRKIH